MGPEIGKMLMIAGGVLLAVGAVLAHTMGVMMKLGNIMTAADKLEVMVHWAKLVKVNFPVMSTIPPREYLKETMKMFFDVLKDYSTLNEAHCAYISQAFTGLNYLTTYSAVQGECRVD